MNGVIASIWIFLNMHERRRLDELPKSVYWSPFAIIGPRNQLFFNEKHLHPHWMDFFCYLGSILTQPCYKRGQRLYILWKEHPSHLTFCVDLCRVPQRPRGRWQFISKGATNIKHINTSRRAWHVYTCAHTCHPPNTHTLTFFISYTCLKTFLFQAVTVGFKRSLLMETTIMIIGVLTALFQWQVNSVEVELHDWWHQCLIFM